MEYLKDSVFSFYEIIGMKDDDFIIEIGKRQFFSNDKEILKKDFSFEGTRIVPAEPDSKKLKPFFLMSTKKSGKVRIEVLEKHNAELFHFYENKSAICGSPYYQYWVFILFENEEGNIKIKATEDKKIFCKQRKEIFQLFL